MTVDPGKACTITMAPQVVKGRVMIGNSGTSLVRPNARLSFERAPTASPLG
jgi:hypothetical protein